MTNSKNNLHPRLFIVYHFDDIINQIDIKTETLLLDQTLPYVSKFTVVLAILSRYHPICVAVPSPSRPHNVLFFMGRRYLNVTHRSKKKDAALKRPIAS